MNERIKQLAEQAGFYFYDMHDVDGEDLGETIEADSWTSAAKFAELIVRECIGRCEQVISDPVPESVDTWLNGGSQCIQEIEQHFGIRK